MSAESSDNGEKNAAAAKAAAEKLIRQADSVTEPPTPRPDGPKKSPPATEPTEDTSEVETRLGSI